MEDNVLNNIYANPRVILSQNDYNKLAELAKMTAKKIEERAREIYEEEGVVKILFTGRIINDRYALEGDDLYFSVNCSELGISPKNGNERKVFWITQKGRQKIAKHVKRYVEDVFKRNFGAHLLKLNEIERLKLNQLSFSKQFIYWVIPSWILSIVLLAILLILLFNL